MGCKRLVGRSRFGCLSLSQPRQVAAKKEHCGLSPISYSGLPHRLEIPGPGGDSDR